MNFKKLVQVVNYVLSKNKYELNYTKLIKMLYIADRETLDKYGFAISEDSYCSMPHGPVLSGLYSLIRGENQNAVEQVEWNAYFYKDKYDLISRIKSECSYDELSKAELEILDDVDKKYKSFTFSKLIDKVHEFSEWDNKAKDRLTSYPIKKEKILKALNKTKKEINDIIAFEKEYEKRDRDFEAKGLM